MYLSALLELDTRQLLHENLQVQKSAEPRPASTHILEEVINHLRILSLNINQCFTFFCQTVPSKNPPVESILFHNSNHTCVPQFSPPVSVTEKILSTTRSCFPTSDTALSTAALIDRQSYIVIVI